MGGHCRLGHIELIRKFASTHRTLLEKFQNPAPRGVGERLEDFAHVLYLAHHLITCQLGTGSDSGFIYQTYGWGYINELEMLQEAGFHPLEVIQAATMNGALTLAEPKKKAPEFGVVRAGLLADLVITPENPLQNFKTLYGNGALYLNEKTGKEDWKGGVKFTIKDGIVYDAKKLLADVAAMVEKQKKERAAKK